MDKKTMLWLLIGASGLQFAINMLYNRPVMLPVILGIYTLTCLATTTNKTLQEKL